MSTWRPDAGMCDEHAVALVKTTAVSGDKTLRYDSVFVVHVTGGKMTEAWVTPVEQAVFDAFWIS